MTEKGLAALKEKIKSVLSQNKKLISPFDLGLAYHRLLEPEEAVECLRQYLESLDKREAMIERSLQERVKEGVDYVAVALFTRPLAHVKTEREWVEQFMKDIQRRYTHGKDSP